MISLSRLLARRVRAVLKKLTPRGAARSARPPLEILTGPEGLRLRVRLPQVEVEYRQPGPLAPESLVLPLDALADLEGGRETPVTLERSPSGGVLTRWTDGGVPQVREYPAREQDSLSCFPNPPEVMVALAPGSLQALADAAQTAAQDTDRYA